MDKTEQLFKPFTQGDDSISRKFGGTGLGLTICKRIIDALGGEIGADSRENHGSTFWFRLPFVEADQTAKRLDRPATVSLPPMTMLMVEDNSVNQIIGVERLQSIGHTVDLAGDGDEALTMVQRKDYDIILLDLHLPAMDGYQVARTIRSLDNRRIAQIPIVALTADDRAEARQRAASSGMNGFLIKPFHLEELNRIIGDIRHDAPGNNEENDPQPLIETGVLRSHAKELGPQTVAMIISTFRSSAQSYEQDIREALQTRDMGKLVFTVHKVKGGASSLGLVRLVRSAERLEQSFPTASCHAIEQEAGQFICCLQSSLQALATVEQDGFN